MKLLLVLISAVVVSSSLDPISANWTWYAMNSRNGIAGNVPRARFAGISAVIPTNVGMRYYVYGGWPGGTCTQLDDGFWINLGNGTIPAKVAGGNGSDWRISAISRSTQEPFPGAANAGMEHWQYFPSNSSGFVFSFGGGGWDCQYAPQVLYALNLSTLTYRQVNIVSDDDVEFAAATPVGTIGDYSIHRRFITGTGWVLYVMDMSSLLLNNSVTVREIRCSTLPEDLVLTDTNGLISPFFLFNNSVYFARPSSNNLWKADLPDFNSNYSTWNAVWQRRSYTGERIPNIHSTQGVMGGFFIYAPLTDGSIFILDLVNLRCVKKIVGGAVVTIGYAAYFSHFAPELNLFIAHGGFPAWAGGIRNTMYVLSTQNPLITDTLIEEDDFNPPFASTSETTRPLTRPSILRATVSANGTPTLTIALLLLASVLVVVMVVVIIFYTRQRQRQQKESQYVDSHGGVGASQNPDQTNLSVVQTPTDLALA